ncbi:MAG: Extracellular solute-binding protein family 5 [Parcubacteria group bacterium GW2011_GWA2_51_10]|nr:MAG: Extracellular solute-binding protein family 5 [Parcubacteria group bacterium GW2011_GWA2_51_10]
MTRERRPWRFAALEEVMRTFRPSERLLLYTLTALLAVSALSLVIGLNASISVVVPSPAGSISEGVVGPPRFINPVLAISQADEDLAQLVYAGLTRALPDGTIVPDMADRFEISDDGTVYTFTLKEGLTFHDGRPLTAEDVMFTIQSVQNPALKSPRRVDWEGVSVTSENTNTVVFKLQRAYAPFLENTSLGIIPRHLWGSIPAEEFPFATLNTHPVGSGPYRILTGQTDSTGAVTSYVLAPRTQRGSESAFISKITFRFYANQDALVNAFNAGEIDSIAGIAPSTLELLNLHNSTLMRVPLPRVFGVFFNQGHAPTLADPAVRAALEAAIDKRAVIDSVLHGYGAMLDGPLPPSIVDNERPTPVSGENADEGSAAAGEFAQRARDILSENGWTFDEKARIWQKKKETLSFVLATGDAPELSATAQLLIDYWRALGIEVSLHVYPLSELNTNVIRPRNYDAILFGEVVGRTPDLFAFWHSSQRNDPGLNLSMYANSRADNTLAAARSTTDRKEREKLYASFAETIKKDRPAIFLYAPEFIYVVPKKLQGVELGILTLPSERFLNVREWYTDTERVWSFFSGAYK